MAIPLFAPRRALSVDDPNLPQNRRIPKVLGSGAGQLAKGREIAALLLWTGAVFLVMALASYSGEPAAALNEVGPPLSGADWVGPVGAHVARAIVSMIGVMAWVIPLEAALLGIPFVRGRKSTITPTRIGGDILLIVVASALVQVGAPGKLAFGKHTASGAVGELFGELSRSLFSTAGSFLVGFAVLSLVLIGRATFSFIALVHAIERAGKVSAEKTASSAKSVGQAWKEARALERQAEEARKKEAEPKIEIAKKGEATIAVLPESDSFDGADSTDSPTPPSGEPFEEPKAIVVAAPPVKITANSEKTEKKADPKRSKKKGEEEPLLQALTEESDQPSAVGAAGDEGSEEEEGEEEAEADEEEEEEATAEPLTAIQVDDDIPIEIDPAAAAAAAPAKKPRAPRKKAEPEGPTIVDTSAALEKVKEPKSPKKEKASRLGFKLPPIDFLVPLPVEPLHAVDEVLLRKNAELLVKTLADYKVNGKVEEILPGPVVTTFEVSPVAGTKVSRVASLADDLALALARKVRIVAPIPGKNRIGFELPNERRSPVSLRDLVEDKRFQTLDAPLPMVLGRDIVGNPVYADLASMPHVIVAGATGAGKSVGLNVMLTSLLYRKTPEELRLLMIDPKVVELAPFDRIPHMLLPVVTDMKQASTALKWAVDEMERRYQLFADAGTKNISTYNAWVGKVRRGEVKNPAPKKVIAKDHNGLPEEIRPTEGETGEAPLPETMPLIVIVVDEFADLMMQQGKDVEAAVARLAQKARAAGMHVILATQRPSVDVITGMIKANFPTRIAFRVAQKIDSRTILDEQGAEHLLGKGDMLIKLNGTNETKRVQCPWVSEEEVQEVTDFLRAQGEPVYDENILKPRDDEANSANDDDGEQDAMYDEAVRLVAETRRCSTSWLQRKLALGYNRAARIVETMERRGLVGPANGAKDREVLIAPL